MLKRVLLIVVGALGMSGGTAEAETALPRFDVKAHCKAVAEFGGSYSASTERGCFEIEQESYNTLKPQWPDLPEQMRAYCLEVAQFGGNGDYMTLLGCVEMELEAAAANEGATFDY